MRTIIAVRASTPTVDSKSQLETYSLTLGLIIASLTIFGCCLAGIKSLVALTVKAAEMKNDFKSMDTAITLKLEDVSTRVTSGFNRIDREWDKLNVRLTIDEKRIRDIELHLHKTSGFVPRDYYAVSGDRLGDSF